MSALPPGYDEFKGTPEDEEIAGELYDILPEFPRGNQTHRAECVRVMAEWIRKDRKNNLEAVRGLLEFLLREIFDKKCKKK